MAATCLANITTIIQSGDLNDITELSPLVVYPIANLSVSANSLFRLETSKQETIKITTSLTPSGGSGEMLVYLSMFRIPSSGSPISLGTSLITEQTQSFQKDVGIGTYVICLKTNTNNYNGGILVEFSGFQVYAKLSADFYTGEQTSNPALIQDKFSIQCPEPILFEVIDGELPPGLEMTLYGKIKGIPPNQDCVESNSDLSPSVNWFGEYDGTGNWYPWGRPYRFLVRISLLSFPDVEKLQWFCIRVYNDWSIDRDNFMKLIPMEVVYEVDNPIEQNKENVILPFSLCPEPEQPVARPRFIDSLPTMCECITQVPSKQEAFSILPGPEIQPSEISIWWSNLVSRSDLSPEAREFVEALKLDSRFQGLIAETTIDNTEERLAALLKEINTTIEEIQKKQIDGRNPDDMDHEYLQSKLIANKNLPFDFQAFTGETFSV